MRNRIISLIEASAAQDENIVFLTGDLGFSVVEPLQAMLGERFINAGVAEANMVSMASSLAAIGFRPFVYSITPFVTARCFEQIRNDVVYQKRKVCLIGVGSGFSYGALGASHHALEDAAIMASLPGMIIGNPANVSELDRFYALSETEDAPVYFRIAREGGVAFSAPIFTLETAAYTLRKGADVTLVASGVTVAECLRAAEWLSEEGVEAQIVSVPVIAPFPRQALAKEIGDAPVVSVFEGFPGNPFSIGVMATLFESGFGKAYHEMTAPHRFETLVGDTAALRRRAQLDAPAIVRAAKALLDAKKTRRIAGAA
ncbi:MAG: hypothetical protein N2444_09645 [Methylocystis sp.]|nr:hypothetical protein [Methylocystis sp.]